MDSLDAHPDKRGEKEVMKESCYHRAQRLKRKQDVSFLVPLQSGMPKTSITYQNDNLNGNSTISQSEEPFISKATLRTHRYRGLRDAGDEENVRNKQTDAKILVDCVSIALKISATHSRIISMT